MKDIHKAIAVVFMCCFVLGGVLVAASLKQKASLSSQELLGATRLAVDQAITEAISIGGLEDAEKRVEESISTILLTRYRIEADALVIRFNDFDEQAAFHFDVISEGVTVRFRLDGVRDPLLAIRLGLDWRWQEDPHHPYEIHGGSAVMTDCLSKHYFHHAADGPDFFARLENRTEDPYHYGVESLLVIGGQIAIDHLFLGGHGALDSPHRIEYGLK